MNVKRLVLSLALVVTAAGLSPGQQSPHGRLSIPCTDCHAPTATSWTMRGDAVFRHETTGFTLAGRHAGLECRSCHADLAFAGATKECGSCHADVHSSELGPECLRCHVMTSWTVPDMRQKHQTTRFPLVGRHLVADCEHCHAAGTPRRFASTSPECISCHRTDYVATMEPSHAVSGFTVECASCHTVTAAGWRGSFDHNLTAFPLTGAHRALICSECHPANHFSKLPVDCYSCHGDDFAAVLSPNHGAGGFSHECLSCHTTAAWSPAAFDHGVTAFPLTGRHAAAACQDCHVGGNYQLAYTGCYTCHQADYAATVNPDHRTGGFSQDCASCHGTSGWSPAAFDHNTTRFALTGKHAAASCEGCHVAGNYRLAYTDCYQCHQSEYEAVQDPNHVQANFGRDCTPCHTTTGWQPSTFDHDGQFFRIYSGRHAGRWASCSTCHDAPADYSVFTCISCHEHSAAETDGRHENVPDYTYTRTSCHPCHRGV